jgi:hypothetical protein
MKQSIFALLFASFAASSAWCQGCSDAGFCTMGAMKPDQPFNRKIDFRLRTLEISFYRGTTALTPVILVASADLSFSLNDKTSLQLKLPYQAVKGTLGETSGLGDVSLCFTRSIIKTPRFDVNVSLGGKIPTNHADKSSGGRPLPMYYQTSLGTFDLVSGISLISRNWLLATGIQHPFNRNDNAFTWSAWQGSDQSPDYIAKYAPAKKLKRGTDIMFRVERNFRFSRLNFSVGLLPIYRISGDRIENREGDQVKPDGASGLALSGIATAGYQFNVRNGVKLLFGRKIMQREHNPDGLTREVVTTIGYFYRF